MTKNRIKTESNTITVTISSPRTKAKELIIVIKIFLNTN